MPEPTYQLIAGIVLLTVITIAYGGTFLLRVTRGKMPANDLQKSFFRAGHAHAGVLVILGLLALTIEQVNRVHAPYPMLTLGILCAAILIPVLRWRILILPAGDRTSRKGPGYRTCQQQIYFAPTISITFAALPSQAAAPLWVSLWAALSQCSCVIWLSPFS